MELTFLHGKHQNCKEKVWTPKKFKVRLFCIYPSGKQIQCHNVTILSHRPKICQNCIKMEINCTNPYTLQTFGMLMEQYGTFCKFVAHSAQFGTILTQFDTV